MKGKEGPYFSGDGTGGDVFFNCRHVRRLATAVYWLTVFDVRCGLIRLNLSCRDRKA